MEWNIKELDCSKMLINPSHPQLVSFMEKNVPSIKSIKVDYKSKVFTKSQVYRYILLMYDDNSDIQKMQQLDWFAKKYQAVAYAGFGFKSGKFIGDVDDMVFGRNDSITDIIIEFLAWSKNMEWQYTVFLQESMLGFVRDSVGRKINKHKSSSEYMGLYKDFRKSAQEFAHIFDETSDFVARFYYKLEEARNSIRPEDYSKSLANGDDLADDNPYGKGYVVDKIKFLGDDEEQVRERISRSR